LVQRRSPRAHPVRASAENAPALARQVPPLVEKGRPLAQMESAPVQKLAGSIDQFPAPTEKGRALIQDVHDSLQEVRAQFQKPLPLIQSNPALV
jgi:hypothetical protein